MIANGVLVVGVLLTLISEFWVLCLGRFIYGLAVGGFSVFCPKYIAETAPVEIKGPAGALSQVGITFGILVAFTIGLGIGDVDSDSIDSFEIQYYWYIVFGIPLVIAAVQVLLLLTFFKFDTPEQLK
jgi:MFS family permease